MIQNSSKKVVALILLICLVFSGCSRLNVKTDNEPDDETSIAHDLPDETSPDDSKDENKEDEDNAHETDIPSVPESQAEYEKYMSFLNIHENVGKFYKEDLDLDGNQEIIIAFGNYDPMDINPLEAYVLRETGNTLQLLGRPDGSGYYTFDINPVRMRGKDHQYIEIQVTNGGSLVGFGLFEIKGNELDRIAYSASPTGIGQDYLSSSTNDDVYDGYGQVRYSYDTMFFDVYRYYAWNGRCFEHVSTSVDTGDYPDNPQQVVDQFLRLNLLWEDDRNSRDVINRLNEINISQKQLDMDKVFRDAPEEWLSDAKVGLVRYSSHQEGASALVIVPIPGYTLEFTLAKNSDKWQIDDIKGEFAIKR